MANIALLFLFFFFFFFLSLEAVKFRLKTIIH